MKASFLWFFGSMKQHQQKHVCASVHSYVSRSVVLTARLSEALNTPAVLELTSSTSESLLPTLGCHSFIVLCYIGVKCAAAFWLQAGAEMVIVRITGVSFLRGMM